MGYVQHDDRQAVRHAEQRADRHVLEHRDQGERRQGRSASLPAYAITVSSGSTSDGSATLSWTPPTQNTNGTALTNLAGYRIYYGNSAGAMTRTVQVANPSLSRYVVENLGAATWYFTVRAYTTGGAESSSSNTATKTVR